ncbi:NAD(P)-dependent glycerol-3-phosphate dehydrogenase [Roseovarius sp. LXJ103]|uniref:NAD(P)H-dependent glycerol-3-phosphate dehydrogenase n=1 Tax=Roseovarius carneus TaxID=2853164 RepID=UPI000D61B249|nr:NAD(P)H-dependent glycerol-3-phosphate dehydrogenase [Roseovarius carneus]MBZ8118499.1 NAD(P)-dependent glycerol-3-phosphate dehydrogenase [Roseovarius carneus]PWE35804.1 glycerol-3-phosphate dehydrogenase [Pelagicola sp. LXJ1103]
MITVLGAGAFGTGLAITLAQKGPVALRPRTATQAQTLAHARENATRLPGAPFPDTLEIHAPEQAFPEGAILLAVPMQQLRTVLEAHGEALSHRTLVACCKGVELSTLQGPASVITQTLPEAKVAILSGPGFAADIAVGLPTAMTLACADVETGRALRDALSTQSLRLYGSTDTTGVELGGALKNVIAIACGVVMGAGLGESARAALMTRGYAEMQRMALALGARPETLAGLSGFGDLALTCTSQQSRNLRYGMSLGQGAAFDASITVEGAATARAVAKRAEGLSLDMPITFATAALVTGQLRVGEAMDMLLSRPLKEDEC